MKVFTATLVVLVSSFLIQGCGSMNRADSERMLDLRAGYGPHALNEDVSFQEGGVEGFKNRPVPTRSRAQVAAIYAHPHEMPSRDYFWGGWISVVVEQDQWVMSKAKLIPKAEVIKELPAFIRPGNAPSPVELMPERRRDIHDR